jgi:hypothetical protein
VDAGRCRALSPPRANARTCRARKLRARSEGERHDTIPCFTLCLDGGAGTGTAFVYSNGRITSPSNFWPNAINAGGVMVGTSSIDSGGTVHDLNSLIPAGSGDQISYATAINDNGQIVADGSDATTGQAALLLTP